MATLEKDGFIQQIRDQNYYIEIVFYNQIEGETPVKIPFLFVDSLLIHETLQYWPTTAEIVINTDFELFNRGITTKIFPSPDNSQKVSMKAPYIDRPDGRNRVSIRIYPINVDNPDESNYPKDKWEMSYDFVVVDIQDMDTQNAQRKKRKYVLVDERYQILNERNIEWSTAIFKAKELNQRPYQLTDEAASMNPNLLLKEIIKLTGTNLKGSTSDTIKVGYLEGGSILDPTIDFANIDEENWDVGNDSNKLKANTIADSYAIDDVNYILAHCVSSNDYPVLLDFGRSSEDKSWKLISLEDIFKTSNDEQVERLFIEDSLGGDDGSTPHVARALDNESTNTKNFTSIVASRINKYKFSPMVGADDSKIINNVLHWYDHSLGEFVIKMKDNSAVSVLETMKKMANAGLYSFQNGNGAQIVSVVNQTKAQGYMTKNSLSVSNRFISPVATRNKMLLDLLFLNQSISFQSLGLTIRAPGRFIFIDRIASGDSNPFDDRFLGQWLVTGVKHYFSAKTYITEVVATKVDSFGKLWSEIDNKY